MVEGLDRFREHFAPYADRYVLIGGAAADVLLDRAGADFRVTKDLDIVLIVEALDGEFGQAFWDFVVAGKYGNRAQSTGAKRFYRFERPQESGYPYMLELFARRDGLLVLPGDAHLGRMSFDDEASSLSAILLDDEYYEFIKAGGVLVSGVSLIDAQYLIPLKARAWLDLTRRRDDGERVQSSDISKHRADVVRVSQLLTLAGRLELPPRIATDMADFLTRAFVDGYDPVSVGVRDTTIEELVADLAQYYGLDGLAV